MPGWGTQEPGAQEPGTQKPGTEEPGRLPDVVVTAPRDPQSILAPAQANSMVDPRTIRERMPQTTPDVLDQELGVVVQKTNQGGGSPVVRGRTGKETLLLIDGQRFNDATFRRNTQYLNTIDIGAVDRIEVVRGPASVLHGSDAMGGSVNVITSRRDPTGTDAIGGYAVGKFESANLGLVGRLGIDAEVGGFGFTAGSTYKRLDDLRAGSHGNPIGAVDIDGRQVPTAYDEIDFDFSVTTRLNSTDTIDFLVLYSRQEDVPRSDVLIANENQPVPPDLVRDFDPQVMRWYEARFRHENRGMLLERLDVTLTFNNPEETRHRVQTSSPQVMTVEEDESVIPGLRAQATFAVASKHHVVTGIEANHQTVQSSRYRVDSVAGTVTPQPGRFPDDAVYASYGVYVQDECEVADGWTWTNGLRWSACYTKFDLGGLTVGPAGPFGELSETFSDWTFATALSVRLDEHNTAYASFSKGFRAPNLDDLAVLGDFSSGERIPNLDVDPETVLVPEIGLKHRSARFRGECCTAVAFYDDLLDSVFAFSQGGTDFFVVDNIGRATIWSVEMGGAWVASESDGMIPEHSIYAQAFANVGHNDTANEPVSKVPPPQAEAGWRLDAADGSWFAQAYCVVAMPQNRLSAADRADPRFSVDGTSGWWTVNVRGGLPLDDGVRLTVGVENIFDQRYRVHGSGIDAPGFNAVVQMEIEF